MSAAGQVKTFLEKVPEGVPFRYIDVKGYEDRPEAVMAEMNRQLRKGAVTRLGKGQFYKPKKTRWGTLAPGDDAIIQSFVYKGRKREGYVGGVSLYNKLGLTTQLPKTVVIKTNRRGQTKSFTNFVVKFEQAKAPIQDKDVKYLELLDVLSEMNSIPDTTPVRVLEFVRRKFQQLERKDTQRITKLAVKYYPPKTRALSGYLLSEVEPQQAGKLKKTLNPTTWYKLGFDVSRLPGAMEWHFSK